MDFKSAHFCEEPLRPVYAFFHKKSQCFCFFIILGGQVGGHVCGHIHGHVRGNIREMFVDTFMDTFLDKILVT